MSLDSRNDIVFVENWIEIQISSLRMYWYCLWRDAANPRRINTPQFSETSMLSSLCLWIRVLRPWNRAEIWNVCDVFWKGSFMQILSACFDVETPYHLRRLTTPPRICVREFLWRENASGCINFREIWNVSRVWIYSAKSKGSKTNRFYGRESVASVCICEMDLCPVHAIKEFLKRRKTRRSVDRRSVHVWEWKDANASTFGKYYI